ncbi:MAG TPA: M24 family metallopeptidase [Bryobacteraceae bacterium]|nr:M24 family metallopeptidase [Bryobacteraceae bacterium]
MALIDDIQKTLKESGVGGWLFYDHHRRDPLAYRILRFDPGRTPTRRWFYFIPAAGEPVAIVHRIEPNMLNALPGKRREYASWQSMRQALQETLSTAGTIALQWSEHCAIPYVSLVDGGMVDLIRSLGVEIVSSADLVQFFEARWTDDQLAMHIEAGKRVDAVRRAAFTRISEALKSQTRIDEYQVAQLIREAFRADGLFTDHGPIVAVNANASNPHYEPDASLTSPVRPGDLVLIDMWAKLDKPDAVYYDITWTGYCGADIPSDIQNVFEIVAGARDAAVAFIQDGIRDNKDLRGFMVDDVARGHIREQEYEQYFVHRTGHSIGSDVHGTGANMDNLESHDTRRIIPRTCFSIEPGVYLERFGIRSEVNVYVGEREALVTGEKQEALLRL